MKTTIKTKVAWLVDRISSEGYEVELNTEYDKALFIAQRFKHEAFYSNNIKRFHGNEQRIIADHLMGLPSYLSIPFNNHDILLLAKEWEYDVSTEKKEDNFCDRYWGAIAMIILQLFKRHKINVMEV